MTHFVDIAARLESFLKENQVNNPVSVTLKFAGKRDKHYILQSLHREMKHTLMTTGSLTPQDFEEFAMMGIKWRFQDE